MIQTLTVPLDAQDILTKPLSRGVAIHGFELLKPGHERVRCDARPECAGCNIASHGFLCHFADGSCLKYNTPPEEDDPND